MWRRKGQDHRRHGPGPADGGPWQGGGDRPVPEGGGQRTRNTRLLALARKAAPSCDLLVLDEVCAAVNTGLLPLEDVLDCLDSLSCEVVLTGRDPAPELRDRADYLTEMRKVRHPFDRGVCARTGIER